MAPASLACKDPLAVCLCLSHPRFLDSGYVERGAELLALLPRWLQPWLLGALSRVGPCVPSHALSFLTLRGGPASSFVSVHVRTSSISSEPWLRYTCRYVFKNTCDMKCAILVISKLADQWCWAHWHGTGLSSPPELSSQMNHCFSKCQFCQKIGVDHVGGGEF